MSALKKTQVEETWRGVEKGHSDLGDEERLGNFWRVLGAWNSESYPEAEQQLKLGDLQWQAEQLFLSGTAGKILGN
ncbi:hypothetical protein EYF80_006623 [Liparis tanakae]|uniref:Uncharacterized protein n=1 Tax=Liparis tanakae TaxID=230148 RepID=A0A4Z2IYQ4_9TELE|nr:hypothetical protein EYF80_006623 [Liparis tanakae]